MTTQPSIYYSCSESEFLFTNSTEIFWGHAMTLANETALRPSLVRRSRYDALGRRTPRPRTSPGARTVRPQGRHLLRLQELDFHSLNRHRQLIDRRLHRDEVLAMVKR